MLPKRTTGKRGEKESGHHRRMQFLLRGRVRLFDSFRLGSRFGSTAPKSFSASFIERHHHQPGQTNGGAAVRQTHSRHQRRYLRL